MKKQTQIAVYLRVSTTGQTLDSQRAEVDRWLVGHGIANAIFFTDHSTGDNLDRPGFDALQSAIFHGEVSTVVVYKLDRLARTMKDGINTLCDWLERGVRVVSASQEFDFAGKTGKLIASVLFGVAEMEQETRRERQAAGIANAKAKGIYRGRQPGSTTGDPTKARELHSTGRSVAEIATLLKVSRQTVYRYLQNTPNIPPSVSH